MPSSNRMPTDVETRAAPTGTGRATKAVPGLGIGVLVAALSALGFGYAAQASHGAAAAADVARLAEVAPQDIPAALETVEGTPARLARFKDLKACNARLAWVTVMRAPGQPAGRIRLQSGRYVSPGFELTEAPVRVALPYPAPYATGRGTISVLGATSDAIVALTPAWHVPAQGGAHAHQVTWTPVGACPAGNS
jgi:hypothetical protein